ncbi:hypothetical protein M422DRAFT_253093 [Sphaerobolus stellatus SS14]|uniref:Uncharacterized protein n=1 Tax=Sphaerobolus stellatus (strain SS14) TaxID=990650 RepID=A0A0C9VXE0_SPHS4|nr:hypothetical protein M422DRAFT_268151 [Sphaerobolus stellatus SS14]KIJ43520.1 hypothetical protein M422DRAFT_253093 [Sphaerobolus stellatus SS14]
MPHSEAPSSYYETISQSQMSDASSADTIEEQERCLFEPPMGSRLTIRIPPQSTAVQGRVLERISEPSILDNMSSSSPTLNVDQQPILRLRPAEFGPRNGNSSANSGGLKRDHDDDIVQISDDEAKKVPTPKSTSKPRPAKKAKMVLSDSEDDRLYIAECIIDVELPSVAQNNGRKSKTVKQTPLSFGPIEMDKKTTHVAFLAKIAAAVESTPECLDVQSLRWKFTKPANSAIFPLSSEAGFISLRKKITGSQPTIRILMSKPRQATQIVPEWSADFQQTTTRWNTTQEETTTEDAGTSRRLGRARFDDDLKATVEQLKAKYPEGRCEYHKDKRCCISRTSGHHFELTQPRLLAWAGQIGTKKATLDDVPLLSNLFQAKDAMMVTSGNKGDAGPSIRRPEHVTPASVAYPPMYGSPMPYFGAPAHHFQMPLSNYPHPAMYSGIPAPYPMNAGPVPMIPHANNSHTMMLSSSPPRGEESLEEYCTQCGFDGAIQLKLDSLGFTPGQNLSHTPKEEYEKAGFKYFEWQRVIRSDQKYRAQLKGKGTL